ncbi:MAG: hypothetical protein M3041_19010 [Acidobacteriota bacterium]|nr:hypothetical protein [Acidobacteriota bacterium]
MTIGPTAGESDGASDIVVGPNGNIWYKELFKGIIKLRRACGSQVSRSGQP